MTFTYSRNSSFQSLYFGHPLVYIFPGTLLVVCPGQLSVLSYYALFLFIKLEEGGTPHLPTDLRQRLLIITSTVPISQHSFTHQSSQFISSKLIQPGISNHWMSLLHTFTVHSLPQTAWWLFILVKPWMTLWTLFLHKWVYHISAVI